MFIATTQLTPAFFGVPYNGGVTVAGQFLPPVTYAVVGGNLPPGLNLNPTAGTITGTPNTFGTSTVLIQARDGLGQVATKDFRLTVN